MCRFKATYSFVKSIYIILFKAYLYYFRICFIHSIICTVYTAIYRVRPHGSIASHIILNYIYNTFIIPVVYFVQNHSIIISLHSHRKKPVIENILTLTFHFLILRTKRIYLNNQRERVRMKFYFSRTENEWMLALKYKYKFCNIFSITWNIILYSLLIFICFNTSDIFAASTT